MEQRAVATLEAYFAALAEESWLRAADLILPNVRRDMRSQISHTITRWSSTTFDSMPDPSPPAPIEGLEHAGVIATLDNRQAVARYLRFDDRRAQRSRYLARMQSWYPEHAQAISQLPPQPAPSTAILGAVPADDRYFVLFYETAEWREPMRNGLLPEVMAVKHDDGLWGLAQDPTARRSVRAWVPLYLDVGGTRVELKPLGAI